ncbi:MAG: radical SAM protein [Endomicrobiales bacterium]|nr:radical SAM protein [Endomicrobiales bacterium]
MINFPERINKLYSLLNPCRLCPHECRVNRLEDKQGKCRCGKDFYVSSHNLHFGEEPPISGFSGSGTIFFTNCNLSCVYCQNYPISQLGNGNKSSVQELADMMMELQKNKAHNINFVTPTHVVPFIVEAVFKAREKGLNIPLVYNCGGYEKVETLKLLEGIIDIYMPDAKYSSDENSLKYSGAQNYWEINKAALKEMHRQAGNLILDKNGIAKKGLLIRHLVLPNNIKRTKEVLEFISKEISPDTYLSLMSQYHPAHQSFKYPELSRQVSANEYKQAVKTANTFKLTKGWKQEL